VRGRKQLIRGKVKGKVKKKMLPTNFNWTFVHPEGSLIQAMYAKDGGGGGLPFLDAMKNNRKYSGKKITLKLKWKSIKIPGQFAGEIQNGDVHLNKQTCPDI
jgi:hypothetical protein